MPNFPIIDSHVHLYDVERLRYGWLASVPPINRTHDLVDFDAARGAVEVEAFVFAEVDVDAGLHLREALFAQGIAYRDPRLKGVIAHAPLEKGAAVGADLGALTTLGATRGIRRLIQGAPDPAFCLEPSFLEGLRLLPDFGLVFDLCVTHNALVYALELVRRCPDVNFVLDHIGKPDIKKRLWEPWASQIRELARAPNVACKISGVITEADRQTWSAKDVEPYVAHVIEAFGFDRVMFGGDWPVSELTHRYPRWVEIVDGIVSGASETERRSLYRDTAARVYRLAV